MNVIEDDLIARVRRGDLDAYGEVVEANVRRLRAFVALNAPVPTLIDEIAHETFVFAFRNIGQFTSGTHFYPWLKQIAANLLRAEVQRYSRERLQRQRYVEARLLERAAEEPPSAASPRLDHLEECLEAIPQRMQTLLELRYSAGLPTERIAEQLSQSHGWVRTTLCRVRQKLKDCIETRVAGGVA